MPNQKPTPRYAYADTGELVDREVVDLHATEEVADEPIYTDLDSEGGEFETRTMQLNALLGKAGIERKALLACKRKSGRFANTQERADWRKITAKGLGSTPDQIVYMEWIKYKVKQYEEMNSKPGRPRDFQQLMAGIRSEVLADDWMMKNRDRILQERNMGVMQQFESQIDRHKEEVD